MFKVVDKIKLSRDITRMEIEAPQVARKARAGQFVVLIVDEKGERIPLTLADWNTHKGTITIIFEELGFTTKKMAGINKDEAIFHILGPLGKPTEIKKYGKIICIGGGVGVAEVYPVSRAFKRGDNKVTGIIGARSKDLLILQKEMKEICHKLYITTDDGSYGQRGLVTDILKQILNARTDLVYAIGPVPMMKAVSRVTRTYNITTLVSLNSIMVDATGMCGSCRCRVGGRTKFACVDGPEFDGHLVDFDELEKRIGLFKEQEKKICKQR